MNLKSQNIGVEKSAKDLFEILCDVKNFKKLMPENIAKFETIEENGFIFALSGMPEISLTIKEKSEPNNILFISGSEKVPFSLSINIESVSDNVCNLYLDFNGEFNAMMSMMIKSPIQKFIDTLASNINKL